MATATAEINLTQQARRVLSSQQCKRFEKIYVDPFYVVSSELDESALPRFAISGSTQNVYRLSLGRNGRFTCSCPDAYMNCERLHCICKHACFVIFRVFRMAHVLGSGSGSGSSSSRNVDICTLSSRDVDAMVARVVLDDFDRLHVSSSSSSSSTTVKADFEIIRRPPAPDDECPVCYSLLLQPTAVARFEPLVGCPDCGNSIHRECARRWMVHAVVPSCVFCRSKVWKEFRVVRR